MVYESLRIYTHSKVNLHDRVLGEVSLIQATSSFVSTAFFELDGLCDTRHPINVGLHIEGTDSPERAIASATASSSSQLHRPFMGLMVSSRPTVGHQYHTNFVFTSINDVLSYRQSR